MASTDPSTGLPPDWEVRHSNSRQLPYYFNSATGDSRWEPPANADMATLEKFMASFQATHSHAAAAPAVPAGKVWAAHLLVKHAGSRRPASWKDANITRSKDEARAILEGYEREIREGRKSLGDLAATESDCSSARKKGDLGVFGKGDMQQAFEEAAFALKVGEVSGIVDTASGLHLIQRLG